MKKTYKKPDICFESFELSTNIASCSILGDPNAPGFCAVDLEDIGDVVFVNENAACNTFIPGINDSICYDVPLEASNVFLS